MFYNVYYEDNDYQLLDVTEYEDKIVKVIVRKKSDINKFEKFIDKLQSVVAELKIVENYDFSGWYEKDSETYESEDTITILDRYIEDSETELNKSVIQELVKDIYQEACELV